MKDVQSYIAPTKTATLVDCIVCEGSGSEDEMLRVVSTDGKEQEIAQPCHNCNGSGKLWQDTREVEKNAPVSPWAYAVCMLALLVIGVTGFWCVADANFVALLIWAPCSTILGGLAGAITQAEKYTKKETFYTKTSEPVQLRQQLMQN